MVDITRYNKNNEKKVNSVAAFMIDHTMFAGTTAGDIGKLPDNCLINNAYVVTKEAGNASLTCDFGFSGGAELFNDADMDGTPAVLTANKNVSTGNAETTNVGLFLDTATGKTITAKFSADPTQGKWVLIVEYIEYTLGDGTLLNYAA